MKNKLIIFDFDGTLVDSFDCVVLAFNEVSRKYNLKAILASDGDRLRKLSSGDLLREGRVSFWKAPFVIRAVRKELGLKIDEVELFPEIKNILFKLKEEGYFLCLLTSNSKENVDYFLKKHNLAVFDFVYGGCGLFKKSKILRKILNKYEGNVDEVFSVGDEVRDIKAAKKAGIKSIAVSWGFNSREILEKNNPDYLIDTPEELTKII